MSKSVKILVPELGLDPADEITVSCWLVSQGDEVVEGDRLVELLIGEITFDVPSPASGVLNRVIAEPDEAVAPGAILGEIELNDSDCS